MPILAKINQPKKTLLNGNVGFDCEINKNSEFNIKHKTFALNCKYNS